MLRVIVTVRCTYFLLCPDFRRPRKKLQKSRNKPADNGGTLFFLFLGGPATFSAITPQAEQRKKKLAEIESRRAAGLGDPERSPEEVRLCLGGVGLNFTQERIVVANETIS